MYSHVLERNQPSLPQGRTLGNSKTGENQTNVLSTGTEPGKGRDPGGCVLQTLEVEMRTISITLRGS